MFTFKKTIYKTTLLLDQYYFILIGFFFFFIGLFFTIFMNTEVNYKVYLFLLAFAALTSYSEIRRDVKWIPFLLLAIPFIVFIQYINVHGYTFWGKMLRWQIARDIVVDLNPLFKKIPFNDAAFMRIYQPHWLTSFMRIVYDNGFILPVVILIYRAAIAKDFKRMLRYALSAHIFQVFLITPFYLIFHLQEVWYVLGHPDGMARNFTPAQAAGWTLNCFPSMHTSISFAMFLLVIRERNKLFKYVWAFLCLSVVFSTMYLEIHWVIDVLAGMLLAYATVKLADFVITKLEHIKDRFFAPFYYKKAKSIFIKNYYLDTL